jgi:hypothetical protein
MRNILNQCYSTSSKMQRKILFTAALSVSKDRGTEQWTWQRKKRDTVVLVLGP